MQEDVEHRSVTLAINTAKLTGRTLKSALSKLLAYRRNKHQHTGPVIPHGKQTVKELIGQNQGVTNIEIKDEGIKAFERIARKYGVDFAIKKVKGKDGQKPTYLVFFKGRDTDALTAAFTEYTARQMQQTKRPSVRQALARLMALVSRPQVRNKEQERSR